MAGRLATLGLLCVLGGCFGQRVDLDPKWAPLSAIEQADWVDDGMVTTIEGVTYAKTLDGLVPGDFATDALLTHERVHAVDQRDQGYRFYVEYLAFPATRWYDEQRAWKVELEYKNLHGLAWSAEDYATLASLRYSGMVDYETAWAWFRGLQGVTVVPAPLAPR